MSKIEGPYLSSNASTNPTQMSLFFPSPTLEAKEPLAHQNELKLFPTYLHQ